MDTTLVEALTTRLGSPGKSPKAFRRTADSLPKGTRERLNTPEPRRSPNVATWQIGFKQQSFGVLYPIARNLAENRP
ncbi:MAG: hypothetical protein WCD04_12400, partial [Terriglobia bacterium]